MNVLEVAKAHLIAESIHDLNNLGVGSGYRYIYFVTGGSTLASSPAFSSGPSWDKNTVAVKIRETIEYIEMLEAGRERLRDIIHG